VDSLKSLYWNQGLFLKPQHFQRFGLHSVSVSEAYSRIRSGTAAGISKLVIDIKALKNKMLIIEELECILPDGTLLIFPGNCNLSPVKLNSDFIDGVGHLNVSIAVSPLLEEKSNLSMNDDIGRFLLNNNETKNDLFDPHESTELSTLNYDCRLLLGEQQAKQHSQLICFKIAELVYSADEYFTDGKFIPQAIALQSSTVLQGYVKSLKQSLIGRFEQLESFNSLNAQSGESSNYNISMHMAMSTIAGYIAEFSQFEDLPQTSPNDIYLSLRKLISQLSIFSKIVSVTGEVSDEDSSLLALNAHNYSQCFYRANHLAIQLLNELTLEPELLINLVNQGDTKFVAQISSEFTDTNNKIYLRLRTANNLDAQLEDILNFAKLGADGQVDVYLKRSLPGVELNHLSRKPQGVANVQNSFYFIFDRHSFQWQKIVESNRIGLIWKNAPDDLIVDLVAVKG
jgi:type VI secretion system protein ImpJ